MSTSEIPAEGSEKSAQKVPAGISWAMIIFLVILFSSFFIYDTITHNRKKILPNTNTANTTVAVIPLPPESEQVFSRSGNITKIEDSTISIKSNIRKGKGYQAIVIKIITDQNTEFLREDPAKKPIPLPPGKEGPVYEPGKISLTDLEKGDYIIATASENIKNKSEFVAQSITHIYHSQDSD